MRATATIATWALTYTDPDGHRQVITTGTIPHLCHHIIHDHQAPLHKVSLLGGHGWQRIYWIEHYLFHTHSVAYAVQIARTDQRIPCGKICTTFRLHTEWADHNLGLTLQEAKDHKILIGTIQLTLERLAREGHRPGQLKIR